MTFKFHHYSGWVRGPESDRALLVALGMRGPMIHNGKEFEHCYVPDDSTMENLIENYPGFWPNSFTSVDKDGKHPGRSAAQKWWGYKPKEKDADV